MSTESFIVDTLMQMFAAPIACVKGATTTVRVPDGVAIMQPDGDHILIRVTHAKLIPDWVDPMGGRLEP